MSKAGWYEKASIAYEIKRREEANLLAPFPVYDTEVIEDLKKYLKMRTENPDNEPVTFCTNCLSLHVKTVEFEPGPGGEDRNVDYCVSCGNTDMDKTDIYSWGLMYEEKYGEKFFNKNK